MQLESKMEWIGRFRLSVYVVLLLGILCSTASVAAPLYRWVDENGRVHCSDKPVAQAETLELKPSAVDTQTGDDQAQIQRNKAWFEQERQRRAREQAVAQKAKAKEDKAKQKQLASCKKARDKRDNARAQLKARKRAGVTPKTENKLKLWVEGLERKADSAC